MRLGRNWTDKTYFECPWNLFCICSTRLKNVRWDVTFHKVKIGFHHTIEMHTKGFPDVGLSSLQIPVRRLHFCVSKQRSIKIHRWDIQSPHLVVISEIEYCKRRVSSRGEHNPYLTKNSLRIGSPSIKETSFEKDTAGNEKVGTHYFHLEWTVVQSLHGIPVANLKSKKKPINTFITTSESPTACYLHAAEYWSALERSEKMSRGRAENIGDTGFETYPTKEWMSVTTCTVLWSRTLQYSESKYGSVEFHLGFSPVSRRTLVWVRQSQSGNKITVSRRYMSSV